MEEAVNTTGCWLCVLARGFGVSGLCSVFSHNVYTGETRNFNSLYVQTFVEIDNNVDFGLDLTHVTYLANKPNKPMANVMKHGKAHGNNKVHVPVPVSRKQSRLAGA